MNYDYEIQEIVTYTEPHTQQEYYAIQEVARDHGEDPMTVTRHVQEQRQFLRKELVT